MEEVEGSNLSRSTKFLKRLPTHHLAYPPPGPADKLEMTRTRQMYEQRRIGTRQQLEVSLANSGVEPTKGGPERPPEPRREKSHGRS